MSQSGRRGVFYGNIREAGQHGRRWRVPRLILVLTVGVIEVPAEEGEDFFVWLGRARRFYTGADLEASHTCDHSTCANPDHLVWETHAENIERQRRRKLARRVA